jgi:non-heme chloroperoxidase
MLLETQCNKVFEMICFGITLAGLPIEAFDEIRAGVASGRSRFYEDLSTPFYGANRDGLMVSQGVPFYIGLNKRFL